MADEVKLKKDILCTNCHAKDGSSPLENLQRHIYSRFISVIYLNNTHVDVALCI